MGDAGRVHDHRQHGRDQEGEAGPALLRQGQELLRVEGRHDHRMRAALDGGQKKRPGGVGDGCRVQKGVVRADIRYQVGEKGGNLREFAAGGQHDALGPPGGAAGEADPVGRIQWAVDAAGGVVAVVHHVAQAQAVDFDIQAKTRLAVVNHRVGVGFGQLVLVVLQGFASVQAKPHKPRLRQRVVGQQAVHAVRQQHADPVAGLQPGRQKRVAQTIRCRVEITIAEGFRALRDTGGIAVVTRRPAYQTANLQSRLPGLGVSPAKLRCRTAGDRRPCLAGCVSSADGACTARPPLGRRNGT